MSEAIDPLDPADAAAIAQGVIAPDDARPLDLDDELPTGPDGERLVVWDEVHDRELELNEDPGIDAYVDEPTDDEAPPEAQA
ncbi:hypothetical protein [Paeniglutamicibacter cryotolerans]|uniref:Uncharacterized protein n=1 Tax=Paeniglutamicibacter cryotolerans TaxID=670079 RepID=A0A839QSG7_9MICC|nr:hypothetical protein [Paeniglutamicibacter cryotolerans]MBB2997625.1 hypothetical protein [Paeniglutamicibacter cryotolerans]